MSLPKPYYQDDAVTIYRGDCREILPDLEVFDLLLTDPPYAISIKGGDHVRQKGMGTRKLDFFDGDSDWGAMTALWLSALSLSLDRLSPKASVYAWVGHRQFGATVETLELRDMSTRFLVWAKEALRSRRPGPDGPAARNCASTPTPRVGGGITADPIRRKRTSCALTASATDSRIRWTIRRKSRSR